jgi:hypothetical protein
MELRDAPLNYLSFALESIRTIAPVAQWIEQLSSKELMWVRFLPGAHSRNSHRFDGYFGCGFQAGIDRRN